MVWVSTRVRAVGRDGLLTRCCEGADEDGRSDLSWVSIDMGRGIEC